MYSREGRFERWLLFLVVIVDCFEWLFCYNHLPVPLFPIFLFLFFLLPHDSLLLPSLPHPLALSLSGLVRTQENDDAIFNQQQSIHSCVLCWRSAPSLARGLRLLRSLLFFFFFCVMVINRLFNRCGFDYSLGEKLDRLAERWNKLSSRIGIFCCFISRLRMHVSCSS